MMSKPSKPSRRPKKRTKHTLNKNITSAITIAIANGMCTRAKGRDVSKFALDSVFLYSFICSQTLE